MILGPSGKEVNDATSCAALQKLPLCSRENEAFFEARVIAKPETQDYDTQYPS
jgi:hypothetical protein